MLPPEFAAYNHKTLAEKAAAERRSQVVNKMLMACATLDCSAQGPLSHGEGRPRGWYSVDVEGPFPNGRVSMVLCPGCALVHLGTLIPKTPEAVKP